MSGHRGVSERLCSVGFSVSVPSVARQVQELDFSLHCQEKAATADVPRAQEILRA